MKRIGMIVIAALAFAATVQAAPPPVSSTSVSAAKSGDIGKLHYKSVYHDAHGKVIDAQTFMKRAKAGQSYKMVHVPKKGIAVYTLFPPGFKPMIPVAGLKIHPGQHLPAFRKQTLGGKTITEASLRGRPTLMNFFFAACAPCNAETPDLNAYSKQHPRVRVLALTFDDKAAARDFVARRHFAWPVIYAGQALLDRIGVHSYPVLALFDTRGRLIDTSISGALAGKDSKAGIPTARDIDHWVTAELAKAHHAGEH